MWLPCIDCKERNKKENIQRIKKGKRPLGPGPVMFQTDSRHYWLRCYLHWLENEHHT